MRRFVATICIMASVACGGWQWRNPLPSGFEWNGIATVSGTTVCAVGVLGRACITTDGGSTWRVFETPTAGTLRGIAIGGNGRGVAVGDGGAMLRTSDTGATWYSMPPQTARDLRAVWCNAGGDTCFAAGDSGTMLRSTDTGDHWEAQPTGTGARLTSLCFPSGGRRGFASGYNGTLLATSDGGLHWNSLTTGTTSDLNCVTFDSGCIVGYAAGQSGVILKTANGGANWSELNSGVYDDIIAIAFPVGPPVGVALIYESSNDRGWFIKTMDAGAIWEPVCYSRYRLRCMSFQPGSGNGYAAGALGSVLSSTDTASSWLDRTGGWTPNFVDLTFSDDGLTGYIIGAYRTGFLVRTTNGGVAWDSLPSGFDSILSPYSCACAGEGETAYVAGVSLGWDRAVARTTDRGTTWHSQYTGADGLTDIAFPAGADSGYAVVDGRGIIRTSNAGESWVECLDGYRCRAVSFPTDARVGYVVGDSGLVLKTANAGLNWSQLNSGTSRDLTSVCFPTDATTGYAVGPYGTVVKTTDGGAIWTRLGFPMYDHPQFVEFPIDAQTGFVIVDSGEIYRTSDGGLSWTVQRTGATYGLSALAFVGGDQVGWVCGRRGALLGTQDGGIGIADGLRDLPRRVLLKTTVVRDFIRLAPEADSGRSQVRWLLDASGRRVASLHAGINLLRGVPAGVYFVVSPAKNAVAAECRVVLVR